MGRNNISVTHFFKNEFNWFVRWVDTQGALHGSNALCNWFYVFHPRIYKRIVQELGYTPTNSEMAKIIARDYPIYRRQYALHVYHFIKFHMDVPSNGK